MQSIPSEAQRRRCASSVQIATLTAADLPGAADLAWASFPCQDLSLAGAGAGRDGKRSGAFRAVLVERSDPQGSRLLVPSIRDNSGRDVFTDDPYAARHKLLVMWQASGDVLWVYSGDVGTARIGQDAGTWRKQQTRDGQPQEVRSAFGQ